MAHDGNNDDFGELTIPINLDDAQVMFFDEGSLHVVNGSVGTPTPSLIEKLCAHDEVRSTVIIITIDGLHQKLEASTYLAKMGELGTWISRRLNYHINRQQRLDFPGLAIDPNCRTVEADDRLVYLPKIEFELLWFLARHPQQVFTRAKLLKCVWGYDFRGEEDTVTVHISRLRDKIEPNSTCHTYIHTVWGVGYKFDPSPRAVDKS